MLTPKAYLLNGWNRLDFLVVVVSTIDLIVTYLHIEAGWAAAFKLLRILRSVLVPQSLSACVRR